MNAREAHVMNLSKSDSVFKAMLIEEIIHLFIFLRINNLRQAGLRLWLSLVLGDFGNW